MSSPPRALALATSDISPSNIYLMSNQESRFLCFSFPLAFHLLSISYLLSIYLSIYPSLFLSFSILYLSILLSLFMLYLSVCLRLHPTLLSLSFHFALSLSPSAHSSTFF